MKSGPTLNGATRRPARRSAPIKPVATVVFPLPDAGAAITTAGVLTSLPPASVRVCRRHTAHKHEFAHARAPSGRTKSRRRGHASASPAPTSVRKLATLSGVSAADTRARGERGASPLDAPLALAAHVHRVFDLLH